VLVVHVVKAQQQRSRIVRKAKRLVGRDLWIGVALVEALADVRAGRLSPRFSNISEYRNWLRTAAGRKFVR
jgi:hypothetical protein